mgnify:CR=1 FL=1
MDGLNIVAGDLEFLAKSDETLGDDLKKVDIKGPMEDAKEGMPGSESAKIIPEVTKEITQRYENLAEKYIDNSGEVSKTALDFQQNEAAITNSYEKISSQVESAAGSSSITSSIASKLSERLG